METTANFINDPLSAFASRLASSEPVPGGGGAAALVGALAAALGSMVANLTLGKPRYAAVEEEVLAAGTALDGIRLRLLADIDRDAAAFLPLAKAYRLPDGPARETALQKALLGAALAPVESMETMAEAVLPLETLARKGSRLAVSDAAAGTVLLSSAIRAMSLNVFINTASMQDRTLADSLNARTEDLIETCVPRCETLFRAVYADLKERR